MMQSPTFFLRRSWRFLLSVWVVVALITLSVPIADVLHTPDDYVYTGFSYESVGDIFIYLNLIEQAQQGNILFKNFFTPETHTAGLFQPLFGVLGWVTGPIHLDPLFVWHAARLVLLGAGIVLLYRFLGLFLHDELRRRWALILTISIGGIALVNHEGSLFLAMLFTPLNLFTVCTTLLFMEVAKRIIDALHWKHCIVLCVLFIVQTVVHPYALPLWAFIGGVYGMVQMMRKAVPLRRLVVYVLVLLPLLFGSLLYITNTVGAHPILSQWAFNGRVAPWPLGLVAVFLGFLPFVAIPGTVWLWRRGEAEQRWAVFLCLWTVSSLVLSFSPYPYAGRLLFFTHVPLAILASVGMVVLWQRSRQRMGARVALVFLFVLLVAGNLRHLEKNYRGDYERAQNRYMPKEHMEALRWLRSATPTDAVVFAAPTWDTLLPYYAYRQSFTTLGSTTIHQSRRFFEALAVYAGQFSPEELQQFLLQEGITYVVVSDVEKTSAEYEAPRRKDPALADKYAYAFDPAHYSFLRPAFSNSSITVYTVER